MLTNHTIDQIDQLHFDRVRSLLCGQHVLQIRMIGSRIHCLWTRVVAHWRIRRRWKRVRAFVKTRTVALYWQACTSHLYAPGQVGAARDTLAYQSDEALWGQ